MDGKWDMRDMRETMAIAVDDKRRIVFFCINTLQPCISIIECVNNS